MEEKIGPEKKSPIVIAGPGIEITVAYRKGLGGEDEGLTFDVTTAGENPGARILRFDCFKNTPHYHVGPSGKHNPARDMKQEGIGDPVRWTLEQLKSRLPSLVREAGYEEIAARIDQRAIADRLTELESEILARMRPHP
ncbi:MAG TPA: hypothetical protein VNL14_03610 [Candidatus Acidoferrales bacterium]|nr:hypothetical protein [Candidatus Acidoferrales bacterium]